MFGRKKKEPPLAPCGAAGEELSRGPLASWTLPEPEVLRLSICFFDDPEPCPIHRTAVCQRAHLKMIRSHPGAGRKPVDLLGTQERAWFPGAAFFSLWEGER